MTIRESFIEAHLVKRIRQAGGVAYKWVSPGTIGVPDRIVLLPGGCVIFVELKAPGKKPSPPQVRQHARLERMGMRVCVLDSVAAVDTFMETV